MISEGSCDTEDWCTDAKKISFIITQINLGLNFKILKIENQYIKL